MPYYRKPYTVRRKKYPPKGGRKPYYKKRGYRKPHYKKPITTISSFTQNRFVRMRYCQLIELDAAAGGNAAYNSFRANGIYDPDLTGTGHQPYGYDTYSTLYNHYLVVGSRIKVEFLTAASGGAYPLIAGILTSDDGTFDVTNITLLMEQNKSSCKVISAAPDVKPAAITRNFSARRFFNLKDPRDNRYNIGAVFGSNPSDTAVFGVWVGSTDPAALDNPPEVSAVVTIDYICSLSELKELPQS